MWYRQASLVDNKREHFIDLAYDELHGRDYSIHPKTVYNHFTKRPISLPSPDNYWDIQSEYGKHLSGARERIAEKGWTPAFGGYWFDFLKTPDGLRNHERNMSKRYLTLNPDKWQEVLNSLPNLTEKFQAIPGDISFKVPTFYDAMLTHLDNLVIHFSDKTIQPAIAKAVDEWVLEGGLELEDRSLYMRNDWGQDTSEYSLGGAHSDTYMLALAFVEKIRQRYDELFKMSKEEFGNTLLEIWKEVNTEKAHHT